MMMSDDGERGLMKYDGDVDGTMEAKVMRIATN